VLRSFSKAQRVQTTTLLRIPVPNAQVPSPIPETAIRKQRRGPASGGRRLSAGTNHWHRPPSGSQIRTPISVTQRRARQHNLQEASRVSTRKARRAHPRRWSQTTRCCASARRSVWINKPPEKPKPNPGANPSARQPENRPPRSDTFLKKSPPQHQFKDRCNFKDRLDPRGRIGNLHQQGK